MLSKRIIACLDIKDGRTVKGTNFQDLRDAGDPVELALRYCREGADELVFLDISATNEKRKTLAKLVNRIAAHINIPFTVGGGISRIKDVEVLLENGADKVSINTAAVNDPGLIELLSKNFGSQCIVVAVDTDCVDGAWKVVTHGGRNVTGRLTIQWCLQAVNRGAGEILLTSMRHDGTRNGFARDITRQVSTTVRVPVIASGGAGTFRHFRDVFETGKADAALAASIFHYKEISIPNLKQYLRSQNIEVRL